jgi:hypothetical protein
MDEAFLPLARIIGQMMAFQCEYTDENAGVRTRITSCTIESPLELDITRDADGRLLIGTTPPLYCLQTSVAPSYHRLRFVASFTEDRDG